jgi:putative acetyltransferase
MALDRRDAGSGVLLVIEDDPGASDVRALLARHLAFTRAQSPPEHVHALDVDGLLEPDVSFFSARRDGVLLGVGALKQVGDDHHHVELKSMHTAEAARRQGVGVTVLRHLLDTAARRGFRRVSIETGTMDAFAPARALYSSAGFVVCPPFGSYTVNPYSVCMTMVLAVGGERPAD